VSSSHVKNESKNNLDMLADIEENLAKLEIALGVRSKIFSSIIPKKKTKSNRNGKNDKH